MNIEEIILSYLRSHSGEENTITLLSKKLGLTKSQTRGRLEKLEYQGLVRREPRIIADRFGVERLNYVYQLFS